MRTRRGWTTITQPASLGRMNEKRKRGRPPADGGQRRKNQIRLFDAERDKLREAARGAELRVDPKAGWSTWLRELGLAVAGGDYPKPVRDWLGQVGFLAPEEDEAA